MDLDAAKFVAGSSFSADYFEARKKFVDAAGTSKAYCAVAKGPGGESLHTDVAYFGRIDAENLLVLVSATHGAEAYCGSAAQVAFMRAGFTANLVALTGVLLIHALNAYGFAWDRKATAEGCDLNRNFVDFSRPLPANPGFEELADYLVPTDNSPETMAEAERVIQAYRSRHGEHKFMEARISGQYTRKGGMYYGGTGPTDARLTLEQIVADLKVAERSRVVIIDYHSGLGPYGYGELQCEASSGLEGYRRAFDIFGASVTSPILGTSSAPVIHGSQDDYWERLLGARHTYVGIEFGTYSTDNSRKRLRDDHWLFSFHPDQMDAEAGRQIREHSKKHYYPQERDWEELVIWRCHQVHRQAIEALSKC